MKQQKFEIHDFYCGECGFVMPLPRKKSKKKEFAHLKKLYCIKCKEEVNFIEDNGKSFVYNEYIEEFGNEKKN